jgi:hypothetical protein
MADIWDFINLARRVRESKINLLSIEKEIRHEIDNFSIIDGTAKACFEANDASPNPLKGSRLRQMAASVVICLCCPSVLVENRFRRNLKKQITKSIGISACDVWRLSQSILFLYEHDADYRTSLDWYVNETKAILQRATQLKTV